MAPINPTQVLLGFLFAPQIVQSLTSMYPPFQTQLARKAFGQTPNLVPPPSELVGQRQKGIIDNARFVNLMMEAGYAPTIAGEMLQNARTYISALDYISAWRRGAMSEAELDNDLKDQGLTAEDIRILKVVSIYFPTPQDLVRFGVRDVYSPQVIEQYGTDQDYPTNLDNEAIKAGLTPDIARQYWRAHWELPSPTQVYDLFHRKKLTKEEVGLYLKTADYMPYWRDLLIELSYNNITRVDIRRMYSMGVLSREQVKERYEFEGYSPDDAELLTQFTELASKHEDTNTPASLVISSYKAGTIDRATALERLQVAKVSIDSANLMLDNADSAIRQELIDIEADAITDQYRSGYIDLDKYQTELTRIGVPARLMQLTIAREMAQARKRVKTASKGDLDSWWRMGNIGNKKYESLMKDLGYDKEDTTLYLHELELGAISGADKKFPWAEDMREYHDGDITPDELSRRLDKVTEDATVKGRLMEIAQQLPR